MIKKIVISVTLLFAFAVSMSAQETLPEVHVSYNKTIMDVGNPSEEQLTIHSLWLFWDSPRKTWCDLDLRIGLDPKDIKTMRLQDLKTFGSKYKDIPRPWCIALLMRGEDKGVWYCNYYELNERNTYTLNDRSSELLTNTIQELPGW